MDTRSAADRLPGDVLEEWRAAERDLDACEPGTLEWHRARLRIDALSDEYQALVRDREEIARDLASPASPEVDPPER